MFIHCARGYVKWALNTLNIKIGANVEKLGLQQECLSKILL